MSRLHAKQVETSLHMHAGVAGWTGHARKHQACQALQPGRCEALTLQVTIIRKEAVCMTGCTIELLMHACLKALTWSRKHLLPFVPLALHQL